MRGSAASGRAAPGFTLIELLVVMGIIAVLVALMAPAIAHAYVAVLEFQTRNIIMQLEAAIEAFHRDWSCYPPSDKDHLGEKDDGSANLAYYLMGPEGRGWGAVAGNKAPFGSAPASEKWEPYYEAGGAGASAAIQDAFNPSAPIFYYRAEPDETPVLDVKDNPTDTSGPPDKGYKDQTAFELLVKTGSGTSARWVRRDYVLISPGADRLYGYVKRNSSTGAYDSVTTIDADCMCDDIANFTYP